MTDITGVCDDCGRPWDDHYRYSDCPECQAERAERNHMPTGALPHYLCVPPGQTLETMPTPTEGCSHGEPA